MIRGAGILILAGFAWTLALPAFACSCSCSHSGGPDKFEGVVFEGEVLAVFEREEKKLNHPNWISWLYDDPRPPQKDELSDSNLVIFKPTKTLAGHESKWMAVDSATDICGVDYSMGETYQVAAVKLGEFLLTSKCVNHCAQLAQQFDRLVDTD